MTSRLERNDVSVVVPLYNGRHLVPDCLRSIPSGVEVIVCDDGSTDGAPELVEESFPNVRLLRGERNVGFGANANRGLRAATGRVRVVLNTDARFHDGALEALVAAFDDDAVGIAGPRLVFADGSHQTSAASFPTVASTFTGSFLLNDLWRAVVRRPFRWELGMARADHDHSHDVEWVKGACIAVRDRCVEDTGGFDEGYFMYAEEADLCLRASRAGWRVRYVADATVTHLGGGSTGDPTVHAVRFLDSEARFFERAYGAAVLPRWRAARTIGSALKVVLLAPPAPFSRRARARWRWHRAALGRLARARRPPPTPTRPG